MWEEDGRKRGHFLEGATPWRTRALDLSLVSSLETLLTEMSVLRAEPGRETLSGVWCEDGRLNFTLVTRNNAPLHHLRICRHDLAPKWSRVCTEISRNIVATLLAEKEDYFKLHLNNWLINFSSMISVEEQTRSRTIVNYMNNKKNNSIKMCNSIIYRSINSLLIQEFRFPFDARYFCC